MTKYTLVIGDYSKSSWSMRAWVILKVVHIPFDTIQVRLGESDSYANIMKYSASGMVPVLILKSNAINDSLAIAATLAEKFPEAKLWPDDGMLRAKARSAAAEMHSGFVNLRTQLPFGITAGDCVNRIKFETQIEIDRILQIWRDLRASSRSMKFLCGDFGIVDAMFAPVVFRFRRFGIEIPDDLKSYVESILNYPPIQEWESFAEKELLDSQAILH